ncbi:hypothetical protein ACFVMC_18395 [Nocardia sp. NPDC127579]|uniref:hypothetical protein n=1 Tax=Nocardia sp. NPDC127579 TaxID=3345402 RepID=UPI00362E5FC0
MRFVRTGFILVAVASASFLGAGVAQAATIDVTADLLTCAAGVGLDADTLADLRAGIGRSVEVSAETEAELEAGGCL